MFKNKSTAGKNNICGEQIANLRRQSVGKMSQRVLAEKMQILGVDIDKNAIQRIECGKRFVTDIEIVAFSKVFGVSLDEILMPEK